MPIEVVNSSGELSRFDTERLASALHFGGLERESSLNRARVLGTIVESADVGRVSTDAIRFAVGELTVHPEAPDIRRIVSVLRSLPQPVAAAERQPEGDMSLGRAFVAGLMGGISRHLAGVVSDEAFTRLAAEMVAESKAPVEMQALLGRMVEYYDGLDDAGRAGLTGLFARFDVQSPIQPRMWDRAFWDVLLAQSRGDKGAVNDGIGDADECCQQLEAVFSYVKVDKVTELPLLPSFADDVAMTAFSVGFAELAPVAYAFPETTLKKGEDAAPNATVAAVKPARGKSCPVALSTTYTFIEVDTNKIDDLLRQALAEMILKTSGAAPLSVVNLVRGIIDEIVDALGLKDDVMDQFTVNAIGGLHKKHVKLSDQPGVDQVEIQAPVGMKVEFAADVHKTATLSKTIKRKGGEWPIKLTYRING